MLKNLVFAVGLVLVGSGCGALCNEDNACAVTGSTDNMQVCDGSNFVTCDDKVRGKTVSCERPDQVAVCTTSGWAFDTAGPK